MRPFSSTVLISLSPIMAYDIDQLLTNESGRIGPDIHKRSIRRSIWTSGLIESGLFPEGMGSEISTMVWEASMPTNQPTWTSVGFNTGSGNNCVPTAEVIGTAQTLRTYGLKQTALEGSPLCVNDVRFSVMFPKQLANMFQNLQNNVFYTWQDRNRDEYIRLAEHKAIAHTDAMPEGSASFPLTPPTSKLTQGILDNYYLNLTLDGAGEYADGMVQGQPQFTLVTSAETSKAVLRQNSDIREDFRWAFTGKGDISPLLAPFGVKYSYSGFIHMIDPLVPRWEFELGAWVRVDPYVLEATTNGTRAVPNPAYRTATYEDSIIFLKSVYKRLVPKPLTNPGGGVKFDPISYMGEFRWLNIPHRTENPDGNIGFYRAVLASGSEPILPNHGIVIRHLRCDPPRNLVTCS